MATQLVLQSAEKILSLSSRAKRGICFFQRIEKPGVFVADGTKVEGAR
jgi:hypothetical protein